MFNLRLLCLFALIAIAPSAFSLDFSFQFSNDGSFGIPGTVTGRILGLADDAAGQSATQVLIDSVPGFHSPLVQGSDATAWTSQYANAFDVSGGSIVGYLFDVNTWSGGSVAPGFQYLFMDSSIPQASFGSDRDNSRGITCTAGGYCELTLTSSAVVFAPLVSDPEPPPETETAVPEPASYLASLAALLTMLGLRRHRKTS